MISVTLSANAGVSLSIGGAKIWVDALFHRNLPPGFSALSQPLLKRMAQSDAFTAPDVIFVTHLHPDHYSRELVARAVERWPKAVLMLPQQEFPGQILISGQTMETDICGLHFRFFSLPHQYVGYPEIPHYGAVISGGGESVLVTGDCEIASPALAQAVRGERLTLALVDFPWIILTQGREFLSKELRAKHLAIFHLPFAQDDGNGYRAAAERSIGKMDAADVRLLWNPMQTESFP